MNIIFLRHGEATDNVKQLISDKEIYWSTLTENGIKTVKESLKKISKTPDKIYVSPLPRTIQTAHYVYKEYPKVDIIIENRLHEIKNGKYSGKENNKDLDNTREKQIAGDYFIRFGQYGENKYEIEERLSNFLTDVYKNNMKDNTIMIVSHGSITSYMKRLLNIKTPHIKTGKLEEFIDVNFSYLFEYIKKLKKIKAKCIKERIDKVNTLNINKDLKNNLIKLCKKEFNNIEFPDDYFNNYIEGLSTRNLQKIKTCSFNNDIILICFYNNFENFARKWIEHYINIGIKNYVLINNNSTDNSTRILKEYSDKANIEFWTINDNYNCYKMCGWKQQILNHYGTNRKYLTVDSDELLIYNNYKNIPFTKFIETQKVKYIKCLMLDVYNKEGLFKGNLKDYNYIDKGTYKINNIVPYKQRFYGGPRSRIFEINPSLQKIPFINYSGKQIYANDHYYYPFKINEQAKYCAYLLHYKFLPGDKEKYKLFAKDGRHWNNSHEYKIYDKIISKNNNISFYDEKISVKIKDIEYIF